jgi:predicted transcriptional regulator
MTLQTNNGFTNGNTPAEAIWALKREYLGQEVSWRSAAEFASDVAGKKISHTTLRDVANNEYKASKDIIAALVELGLYVKKPKDPRPRTWMRTDNVEKAINTLFKHHPHAKSVILQDGQVITRDSQEQSGNRGARQNTKFH